MNVLVQEDSSFYTHILEVRSNLEHRSKLVPGHAEFQYFSLKYRQVKPRYLQLAIISTQSRPTQLINCYLSVCCSTENK
jgi:hypothetical protein